MLEEAQDPRIIHGYSGCLAPCLYPTQEALRTNKQEPTEPRQDAERQAKSFPASTPP